MVLDLFNYSFDIHDRLVFGQKSSYSVRLKVK